MCKQLAPLIYEKDWERFDGFTPTFTHPSLTADELSFLLGAAYTRFYMRPSCFANYCGLQDRGRRLLGRFDRSGAQLARAVRARRHGTGRHMLTAIPRYGARVIPNTEQTIDALREEGQLVHGPHIAAFEHAFAVQVGARTR